jgi:Caspase domain
MLRIVYALFLLAGLLAGGPSFAKADARLALVIGNASYQFTPALANPRNDAQDMAAVLKQLGFTVIEGYDLDKASFDKKIKEFAIALAGKELGVFFYAGHGLQVAGTNYLVPVDAELATAASLDFEMVRFDIVQKVMERENATNILFIDACRNNPLARNLKRAFGTRALDIGQGLAAAESGSGTLISFSTQPGNFASDGAGRNSPYTGPLVRYLAKSGEDLNSVLIDVRNEVMKTTQSAQIPWEHSALTKRISLNGSGASFSNESAAGQAWSEISKSNNAVVLEGFLKRYENTLYGELARARLAKLKAPAIPVSLDLLDKIPRDAQARLVQENVISIEPRDDTHAGMVASDLFAPHRGFLNVDFAIQPNMKLRLYVLTEEQKTQINRGEPATGKPLATVEIEGTASHQLTLERGAYLLALGNQEPTTVQVAYRVTFREY